MNASSVIGLDQLLAFAAIFLGLSLLVQVVQELFKFLFSANARVFRQTLLDTCGPWIDRLYETGPATRLHVRTPFQFVRSKPGGVLLPTEKKELLELVDLSASDWVGFLLEAVKSEEEIQAESEGEPRPPSPRLGAILRKILETEADEGELASGELRDVASFVEDWGLARRVEGESGQEIELVETLDAKRVRRALYQGLMPERARLEREYSLIQSNYRHSYHRRNLRYSFLFGLLLAFAMDFPLDTVWKRAAAVNDEQAVAMAQEMIRISDEMEEGEPREYEKLRARASEILQVVADASENEIQYGGLHRWWPESNDEPRWLAPGNVRWGDLAGYFWYCLFTAVLISFGAPFWHRLSEALLSARGGGSQPAAAKGDKP